MDLPDSSCPDLPEDILGSDSQDSQENEDSDDFDELQDSGIIVSAEAASIIKQINDCLVPKLSKNYDESENHAEFDTRNNNLVGKVRNVVDDLEKYDFEASPEDEVSESKTPSTIDVIAALLNLYKELKCSCSWNSDTSKECAQMLNDCFHAKCRINVEDVLRKNEMYSSHAVFEKVLDDLCKKLTSDNFKKYPGQIEIYSELIQNSKDYNVKVDSLKFMPVALILTDDYIESNKIKGLLCCRALLKNLTDKDFNTGNYYDVIYLSVKNALNHKDLKITELSQTCSLELCRIFPSDVKDERLDEMYTAALDQLNTESNLYRKAAFFRYTKKLMDMLEIKCVEKSMFKTVICDALDNCLTDSVAEILLMPSLQCLEEWVKYCWPVWKLPVDFKVLCALLKYYSKCNTGEGGLLAQKLIVTLVSLCTPDEQKQFTAQLQGKGEGVSTKLDGPKKDIGVNTNTD